MKNANAPTNSNNNCRSPQRGTAVAALSSAFAKLSSAEDSGKSLGDSFVHINSTSSQKGAAMTALSSVVNSAKESSILDGDWVALSSPMMKVEVLDDTEAPSVCTAANSNREDDYVISVLDGTEAPSLCTASNSNDGEEDYVSSVLDGAEARSHCAIANSKDGEENYVSSMILSHESLKTKSVTSASGIDPTKKETYLSSAEFRTVFGISRTQFYSMPKWKQLQYKKAVDLF